MKFAVCLVSPGFGIECAMCAVINSKYVDLALSVLKAAAYHTEWRTIK